MKRAIVDVDGTLYNFHKPLHVRLHELYDFPIVHTSEITHWDWYFDYGITKKEFYKAVDDIHNRQLEFEPFMNAYELFAALDYMKFEVFVASHRSLQSADILSVWLWENALGPYTAVYAGPNKKQFFRTGDVLIDDAPHTIDYGCDLGMDVIYTAWPWNKGRPGERVSDLADVIHYLEENYNGSE